jgi:hypothetical protein
MCPSICNKLYVWWLLQEYFDIARTTDYSIPLRNNKYQTISNHCIILLLFVQKVEVLWCGVRDTFISKRAEESEKFENLKTQLWDEASLSALVLWVVTGL